MTGTPKLDRLDEEHCELAEEGRALATLAGLAGREDKPQPLFREIPEPAPYPLEALGPTLASAAEAIHSQIQAPKPICAQSVLGAAALAVQGFADVELPIPLVRPVSLSLLTIAASGERKTSADQLALEPIREREKELAAAFAQEMDAFEVEIAAWEKQKQQALGKLRSTLREKRAALESLGRRPPRPLIHLLTCPEPTYEGLVKLFAEGQPSLGLFASEGGQFLGGFSMGKDHKLKTATALNALWDGAPIRRVRAGEGSFELSGRRLSIHLLVQPEVASELLSDRLLAGAGTLSRLLVAAPPPAAGTRYWRDPDVEALETLAAYRCHLREILRRLPPLAEGTRNTLSPRILRFSETARALWGRFADHVEKELKPGGLYDHVRAFASKLPEHASRLAAVCALVEDLETTEVAEEDLARGIQLAQFYGGEALRLHEIGATDPELLLAQRTLNWLVGSWPHALVSLPDIYQKGPRPVRDQKTARRIAGVLEEHGWLEPIEGGGEVGGAKRRKVWRIVNP